MCARSHFEETRQVRHARGCAFVFAFQTLGQFLFGTLSECITLSHRSETCPKPMLSIAASPAYQTQSARELRGRPKQYTTSYALQTDDQQQHHAPEPAGLFFVRLVQFTRDGQEFAMAMWTALTGSTSENSKLGKNQIHSTIST